MSQLFSDESHDFDHIVGTEHNLEFATFFYLAFGPLVFDTQRVPNGSYEDQSKAFPKNLKDNKQPVAIAR